MSLPLPPREVPRCFDVTRLAPKFADKVSDLIVLMEGAGHDPLVYETERTDERQQFLYGFGRHYDDGRGVVTYSEDADETWHGFGLACDIISRSKLWTAPLQFWKDLERFAELLGLRSGRDWDTDDSTKERFVDSPHVQWGSPMRRSPSPRAARLREQGGLMAVWREVQAA